MKVIAIAGTGSGSGKTLLICRLLGAIPGLGAVKISPRDTEPRLEWGAGVGREKDTARYAAAGALKVARIVAPRARVPELWGEVVKGMRGVRGIAVEGSCSLTLGEDRLAIVVVARNHEKRHSDRLGIATSQSAIIVTNTSTFMRDNGQSLESISHSGNLESFEIDLLRDSGEAWKRLLVVIDRFVHT